MRTSVRKGSGYQIKSIGLQRIALFFFVLVLAFGLVQPGMAYALKNKDSEKTFNDTYSISPLKSTKQDNKDFGLVSSGGSINSTTKNSKVTKTEDASKRTAHSTVYKNSDGTKTYEYFLQQKNYQDGNKWEPINNSLSVTNENMFTPEVTDSLISPTPKAKPAKEIYGEAGNISAYMMSLSKGLAMTVDGKTITMRPVDATNTRPEQQDETTTIYRNAWRGVDISYQITGELVKENIIIRDKNVVPEFEFAISGGKLINDTTKPGYFTIDGLQGKYQFGVLNLSLANDGLISTDGHIKQEITNHNSIRVTVDKQWLTTLPTGAFPVIIDPSFGHWDADATDWMYKSDGYSCQGNTCWIQVGSMNDGSWKSWRSYVKIPYSELAGGKKVLGANIHAYYNPNAGPDPNQRYVMFGHANCIGWNCRGTQLATVLTAGDFDVDVTGELQNAVNGGDMGIVWSLWGEEVNYKTYKTYSNVSLAVTYDNPTPEASPTTPDNGQVLVDTQPTLKVNPVSDPDGAVKYYFRVATQANAESGAVINSGWINSPQWTIPEGTLQDGTTYYWHVYTGEATQTNPSWVRSFKVNLRLGKDSTQSYDAIGPIGVDLATGNGTINASTHTMNTLGGSIGLTMDYTTPNKAQKGLSAEYWNIPQNYNFASGVPKDGSGNETTPNARQRSQAIDFDWGSSSPAPGISADWFYTRWTGQFIAPVAGTYQFGGSNDDNMHILVNNVDLYNQGCYSGICYDGSKSVTLAAGQVVPIRIDYYDATGLAYAKLYVKGAVSEQIVPSAWLSTNVSNRSQAYGLTGRYYTNNGDRNIDAAATDSSRLMMTRQDTSLNLNFGDSGVPAPGMSSAFLTRWTGYLTVPESGSYTFGTVADDGVRIKIGTTTGSAPTTVLDSWSYIGLVNRWGNAINLTANTSVPITVDFVQDGGPGSIKLIVRTPSGTELTDPGVPATWLTPQARALPEQWQLGVNIDGGVNYERLRVGTSSVILEDSTGGTHEYIYTNGAYKPPVNEDGVLVKNIDNTYTLTDTDGRVYIFDANGVLISLTTPTDDRNPAALKYIYSGSPSRLVRVEDGVTSARYATVVYRGVNEADDMCDPSTGSADSGFLGLSPAFDQVPTGMICGFKTSDGRVTKFYYSNGNLARIIQPGNVITDYAYDNFGRITQIRDSLAADVISAGIRSNDSDVTTEVAYDTLGRIASVTAPAATESATRLIHTLGYMPGYTDMHVVGVSEPNGYSKRVTYDGLLRTTQETDLTGKTVTTEWDPVKDLQLSTTDATGLKSTTIYDSLDRPTDSYGPAPASWFGSDRKPLTTYASQTPRVSTGYDENISGLAVSVFNNSKLLGTPKLYTTGFNQSNEPSYVINLNNTNVPPTDGLSIRATGKIRLDQVANYTFRLYHGAGARLYIDNQLRVDDWTEGAERFSPEATYYNDTVGKYVSITVEAHKSGSVTDPSRVAAVLQERLSSNGTYVGTNLFQQLTPAYNLTTSTKAYDAQLGNVETQIQYSDPAYGTVSKTVLDPTGLNYGSSATYETPGSGYLRQTSNTLPGGATTTYGYYGNNEVIDNPCTPENDPAYQAGLPKIKVEPDPDGAGPQTGRTTETVYNSSGFVAATRYNNDPWTCNTYDNRERIISTVVPSVAGNNGTTITNNYAVDGNPLISSVTDGSGTITTYTDLLGRNTKYVDTKGNTTTSTYDNFGKLLQRVSPIGSESFTYDQYDRLITQKLDGVTFATVTYDEFSRVQSVQYPAGISLQPAVRDALGRVDKVTYDVGGQSVADEVTRSVSGLIMSGAENGVSKNYTYDKADRLVAANIGSDVLSYGYDTPNSNCTALAGNNPNAAKDSNRTSYTLNGATTTYCYNAADQLTSSSDARFTNATYDTHGNTLSLGDTTHKTEFTYDSLDQNTGIKETSSSGVLETTYQRDANARILHRTYSVDGSIKDDSYYGFIGSGDNPAFLTDVTGSVKQKYLSLPGGVQVTIKPESQSSGAVTYSLTNIHGDVMATVNADGATTITAPTGPFGEQLPVNISPLNAADGTSNGYLGAYQKSTETAYMIQPIQMGARVYIPELGRFLQVDSAPGGTLNAYVYVSDPVNQMDINGRWALALSVPWAGILAAISAVLTAVVAALSSPVVIAVAATVAVVAVVAATAAYVNTAMNTRATTQSKASAGTKTITIPKQENRCDAYTPRSAPQYVPSGSANAGQKNSALTFAAASLALGRRPGGPIMGYDTPTKLNDPQYSYGDWQKEGMWYPNGDFEVHYMVSQGLCAYDDLKITKTFQYPRPLR